MPIALKPVPHNFQLPPGGLQATFHRTIMTKKSLKDDSTLIFFVTTGSSGIISRGIHCRRLSLRDSRVMIKWAKTLARVESLGVASFVQKDNKHHLPHPSTAKMLVLTVRKKCTCTVSLNMDWWTNRNLSKPGTNTNDSPLVLCLDSIFDQSNILYLLCWTWTSLNSHHAINY